MKTTTEAVTWEEVCAGECNDGVGGRCGPIYGGCQGGGRGEVMSRSDGDRGGAGKVRARQAVHVAHRNAT